MTLSQTTPTATSVAQTATLLAPISFMALRPPFSPASRASKQIYHHHHCQPNSALLCQNGGKFTSSESRLLSRRSIHTVNYSYPSFPEHLSDSTPSSRPFARHSRRSLYRKGASVDSSRYAFSEASRRSRTSHTVGAVSALGLGFDGRLAEVEDASGSEQYGEVLQAARSVLVGLPGRMDSAGLPALNLVVPTNESMFSVYDGFFTHISSSLSDFWIGLQLPGGDASQTIIFYIAILLLLYGLVLQPK